MVTVIVLIRSVLRLYLVSVLLMGSNILAAQDDLKAASINYEKESLKLLDNNKQVREKALLELYQAKRKAKDFDLKNKSELYEKLTALYEPYYVYKSVYLLSQLSRREGIVKKAEASLKKKDENKTAIIGALTYLESHKPDAFNQYFGSVSFQELDSVVRMIFFSSEIVQSLQKEYHQKLIAAYVGWRPSTTSDGNPYEMQILKEGRAIVPTILEKYFQPNKAQSLMPLSVVIILGEIGADESFDALLKNYLNSPSEITATSLGSSMGSLSMNKLFVAFSEDVKLRELLKQIYGEKWESVSTLPTDEIKTNLLNNYLDIKSDCNKRLRSI